MNGREGGGDTYAAEEVPDEDYEDFGLVLVEAFKFMGLVVCVEDG